jgi:hypothetical protein
MKKVMIFFVGLFAGADHSRPKNAFPGAGELLQ